jgi:hypothetical protein
MDVATTDDEKAFLEKADMAFRTLFDRARAKDELQFAFALSPEMRGLQDAGWNTAVEALATIDDFSRFFQTAPSSRVNVRIALGFYSHLAEASGFYEVAKNMLRVSQGDHFMVQPFRHLVREHTDTGKRIAPNANKVTKDLVGHAAVAGFLELSEVFRDAFDSELRNGYAHADYVIWSDEIRLPNRNGGYPRSVSLRDFERLLNRGLNFFLRLFAVLNESIRSYSPPKVFRARLNADTPTATWTIAFDPARGTLRISDAPP